MNCKETPFGAFDSELMYQEIYIPEGFEATIEGNKIILKKTESEDERIRKRILLSLQKDIMATKNSGCDTKDLEECIAWLEKQGEQKPIIEMKTPEESLGISSEKYNDIVNECLYGESKSTDSIKPKFKVGDWIINNQGSAFLIAYVNEEYQRYEFEIGGYTKEQMNYESIEFADSHYHLWSIEDAKPGDMLCTKCGTEHKKKEIIFIFKGIGNRDYLDEPCIDSYCYLIEDEFYVSTTDFMGVLSDNIKRGTCPATKKQRNILLIKMNDAGYAWNEKEKKLVNFRM